MATTVQVSSCALPPALASWRSLVGRSLKAWNELEYSKNNKSLHSPLATSVLQNWKSLDEMLAQSPKFLFFYFFQRRDVFLSQKRIKKWDRENLGDYILIPGTPGYLSRQDCFFISHYWLTPGDPDPDGKTLRLHQQCLREQIWSYVWLDWTCAPQSPRNTPEDLYFRRALETIPYIIQECGFNYFYPRFEARLWVLVEIAEFMWTASVPAVTEDIRPFTQHLYEMLDDGVETVIAKHGYRCSGERDKAFLVASLDIRRCLRRFKLHIGVIRRVLSNLTWGSAYEKHHLVLKNTILTVRKFDGVIELYGQKFSFPPFPRWESTFQDRDEETIASS